MKDEPEAVKAMNTEKYLGKIESVRFGNNLGYQDSMFGIEFTFSFNGGCCSSGDKYCAFPPIKIEWTASCKWTPEERDAELLNIIHSIDKLLTEAKVGQVCDLKGIPVEITIENRTFKDFRILTEVL